MHWVFYAWITLGVISLVNLYVEVFNHTTIAIVAGCLMFVTGLVQGESGRPFYQLLDDDN